MKSSLSKKYFAVISMVFILVSVLCLNKKSSEITIAEVAKKTFDAGYSDIKMQIDSVFYAYGDTNEYKVVFYTPEASAKACLLMLHGWNLQGDEWCKKTGFCNEALKRGYILIVPDFEKCNYPLHIYNETRPEYRRYPDLQWIIDTVIADLQIRYKLLLEGHNNFVAGISTGGRGAGLLAFYKPEIFTGMASLSGDFDITTMQDEFLYRAWFGDYKQFAERWRNECFAYNSKFYVVPSYVSHGKADKVSPVEQSMAMFDSLMKHHPELGHIAHFPDTAGHNYGFWGSETEAILDFFDGLCR